MLVACGKEHDDGMREEISSEMNVSEFLGDTYETSEYLYMYQRPADYNEGYSGDCTGWHVKVLDQTKTSYGIILPSILDEPITSLEYTFQHCTKMTKSPDIPATVTTMNGTYCGFYLCGVLQFSNST